jgi:hypothetical protein
MTAIPPDNSLYNKEMCLKRMGKIIIGIFPILQFPRDLFTANIMPSICNWSMRVIPSVRPDSVDLSSLWK